MTDKVLIERELLERAASRLYDLMQGDLHGALQGTLAQPVVKQSLTAAASAVEPGFFLDNGATACYEADTVKRMVASHNAEVARLRGEVERFKGLWELEEGRAKKAEAGEQLIGYKLDQANALLIPVRDGYESNMDACIEDENEYMAEQWREKRDEIDAHLSNQAKP